MPVRRSLGVPTVFNFLGPLCNPAGVKRQVIGVRSPAVANLMADVLMNLGSDRVLFVTSSEGADELTLSGINTVVELDSARAGTTTWQIDPREFGFDIVPLSAIAGGTAAENARITRAILAGEPGAHRDTVVLNAAAGLLASGSVSDLADGLLQAQESLDSGRAADVLDAYLARGASNA
jgi:anthranilate phosphoribosyltransferase